MICFIGDLIWFMYDMLCQRFYMVYILYALSESFYGLCDLVYQRPFMVSLHLNMLCDGDNMVFYM